MFGAPSRSSLRDIAGASEEGSIQCWWGLGSQQESSGCCWPRGKPWSLRGVGASNRASPLWVPAASLKAVWPLWPRHTSQACTECGRTSRLLWLLLPSLSEQLMACGACITVPALQGTAGSSFPLPSFCPFLSHLHLRNQGTEGLRERFCKLFQTILLPEEHSVG